MIEELNCLKQTVSRNTNINDSVSEGSKGSEECGRENQYCHRGHLNRHVQTVDRNRNIEGGAGEKSEGNEEHDINSGRKGILVIVAERSAELCPTGRWKA